MVITFPPLFFVMYNLQKIYLRTSRQLRHRELESRSPMYSHFLETLEGLSTIRAFRRAREFRDLNTKQVDDSQKPYYLMFCIQNWLGLVLDLISGGMAVIIVILALNLRHWTSPGLLGVAMNNVLCQSRLTSSITLRY
jgi:ATP-binding cassette subfamily C (CFTR/MRP) protein 1